MSAVDPSPISGIEFFQTRKELDRKYPSISDRLEGVSTVWAMWAVGTRFIDSPADKKALKRLILPNPDCKSAKFYFDTIGQEHARTLIRPTTLKAITAKIEVRWLDYFPFHSITIAGPDDPDGWAYIEHALPYYATEERPGYTIHRKDQPEAVRAPVEKFSEIWDHAKVPTDEELTECSSTSSQLEPMYKVISYVASRISDNDVSKFWPVTRRAIRQAALDGRIQIYGHKSEDTGNSNATSWSLVDVPIPRAYWELADITEAATSSEYADELMHNTRPHQLSDGRFTQEKIEYYAKLMVKWGEVRQNWP